jgi:hypothetical protein
MSLGASRFPRRELALHSTPVAVASRNGFSNRQSAARSVFRVIRTYRSRLNERDAEASFRASSRFAARRRGNRSAPIDIAAARLRAGFCAGSFLSRKCGGRLRLLRDRHQAPPIC